MFFFPSLFEAHVSQLINSTYNIKKQRSHGDGCYYFAVVKLISKKVEVFCLADILKP